MSAHEIRMINRDSSNVKVETREGGKRVITGYAAVFYRSNDPGTEYRLLDDVTERIMPGAFDAALRDRADVLGLANHDRSMLLGRTSSGTMRVSVDERGLKYEIDPPDTQAGRDTVTLIDRGDIPGSSFGFIVKRQEWTDGENRMAYRNIVDVDLIDVGPVTEPAYGSTTASIRSSERAAVEKERDDWRATVIAQRNAADAVNVRAKVLGLEEESLRI